MASVVVEPASLEERDVLANLMRLYRHDLSEFEPDEIDDQGEFRLGRYFDDYWTERERYPFLIRVDQKLVGFALVREIGPGSVSMAEFFITRGLRRTGIGAQAAKWLFDQFRGTWSVAQDEANEPAQRFWQTVIADYTDGDYSNEWSASSPTGPKQVFSNRHKQ